MPAKPSSSLGLLAKIQDLVAQRQTNAYQIAKATGLSRHSVAKLLGADYNPALANAEQILRGLGYRIEVVRDGEPIIEPGTGRSHGVARAKGRTRN